MSPGGEAEDGTFEVGRLARDKAKETFAPDAARKGLERQETEKRRKSRRLNQ